jgi:uncharacterized protein YndB with AHSA1/START domain
MVPNQITHEILVDAPVERVWAVITEAEHIQAWFAFDGATIDLQPGGELVMTWKEHGTYHSRIERIEPHRLFSWRWARLPGEQPRPGDSTLVEFTLTPEGAGTRLRVVESGFHELALPEADQAQWATDNTQGWQGGFDLLKEYAQRAAA